MVLALHAQHIQQIDIGRGCSYKTVNNGVAGEEVVGQQRVRSRDVAVNGIIVNTVSISVITVVAGRAHLVVKHPCRWVVGLDGGLYGECAQQKVRQVSIQTLYILVGVRDGHVVLIRVRIDKTCAELHELRVHCVVHAGGEALVVRPCTFQRTLLVVVVETNIISIVRATTTEVHVVVLTDTRLEDLLEPVGVGVVHEMIVSIGAQAVAARSGHTRVLASHSEILAVLVGVHHVVDALRKLVDTEIALITHAQRLVFLTALGRDDHHTVSGTRTVDGACRSILQHLDGLNVIR